MTEFVVPRSVIDGTGEKKRLPQAADQYFSRAHHNPKSYDRIENWLPDVEQFTFKTVMVPISGAQAHAILKFRDEVKLRAAVRDQERREASTKGADDGKSKGSYKVQEESKSVADEYAEKSINSNIFLDQTYEFLMQDWARDPEVNSWRQSLEDLQNDLDKAIKIVAKEPGGSRQGAFVKLSTRSPKDASLNMTKTYDYIRARLKESKLRLTSDGKITKEIVREDLSLINESLCVRSGQEALRLILESDRAHSDITANRMYLEEGERFNLKIAVREWCEEYETDWEFRLFVMDGEPTALTIYNDFFFDERIVAHKAEIEKQIMQLWERVRDRIHRKSQNYCIDFALAASLEKIFIIEVNNFVAPVAGSGLFDYHKEADRKCSPPSNDMYYYQLLEEGPFSFRIRTKPLKNHAIEVEGVGFRTIHPPLTRMMMNERLQYVTEKTMATSLNIGSCTIL